MFRKEKVHSCGSSKGFCDDDNNNNNSENYQETYELQKRHRQH